MANSGNYIQVVGVVWAGYDAAYEYSLTPNQVDEIEVIADIRSLSAKPGDLVQDEITREDVAEWLQTVNTRPDFDTIIDFTATIHNTIIEWGDLENAAAYQQATGGGDSEQCNCDACTGNDGTRRLE